MIDLNTYLQGNPYPGRGIFLGRSADNQKAVIAYFIMGRSENSRNRIFETTEDGIRTKAFDESKMVDPSLIIYHPVRVVNGTTVVTNGDQTDTVADALRAGQSWVRALRTREFEPDGPNFTPRISGMVRPDGSYRLSILKNAGDGVTCNRFFYEYDAPLSGVGHFLSTYQSDGSPLPSFSGDPLTCSVTAASAKELGDQLWQSLNGDNKVSLYVSYIDIATGKADTVLYNKHQEA